MPTNLNSRSGRSERIYWSCRQCMFEIPKPLTIVGRTRRRNSRQVQRSSLALFSARKSELKLSGSYRSLAELGKSNALSLRFSRQLSR